MCSRITYSLALELVTDYLHKSNVSEEKNIYADLTLGLLSKQFSLMFAARVLYPLGFSRETPLQMFSYTFITFILILKQQLKTNRLKKRV